MSHVPTGALQPQKVSIVTGANSGIGLEVAAGLRQAGHHVILACRSTERCAAAKASLDARRLPGSCECRQLDLGDYGSIRQFAAQMHQQRTRHAVLVNNAGVMAVPATPAGEDGHLVPNHFGPYLLTRLLLPLMEARGRVVTVASQAHYRGSLHIDSSSGGSRSTGSGSSSSSGAGSSSSTSKRLALAGRPGNWYAEYARSKLCNVLMTAELTRHLQARRSSIIASSVSPGRVNTRIFDNMPPLLQGPVRALASAFFQTPAQGASTVLHAALAQELEGQQDVLYLHSMRPRTASPAARDATLAAQLWQLSNQEVGLSEAEDAALWPPH